MKGRKNYRTYDWGAISIRELLSNAGKGGEEGLRSNSRPISLSPPIRPRARILRIDLLRNIRLGFLLMGDRRGYRKKYSPRTKYERPRNL